VRSPGLAVLILLALSAPASAATVSVENGTLRVMAHPGEENAITVAPQVSWHEDGSRGSRFVRDGA